MTCRYDIGESSTLVPMCGSSMRSIRNVPLTQQERSSAACTATLLSYAYLRQLRSNDQWILDPHKANSIEGADHVLSFTMCDPSLARCVSAVRTVHVGTFHFRGVYPSNFGCWVSASTATRELLEFHNTSAVSKAYVACSVS